MLNSQKLIQLFSVQICTIQVLEEWRTDSKEHLNMIPSGLTVSYLYLFSYIHMGLMEFYFLIAV